jgi:hypothetical protein
MLNKRLGRIKIRGLPENLSEAVGDVHKIILDVDRQKQKHQHAQLVKDMVQWYFISVEDTGQTLEEYPAEVNLTFMFSFFFIIISKYLVNVFGNFKNSHLHY